MAEPAASTEWLEWIKVVSGAAVTALGTAWGFLKSIRQEIMDELGLVKKRVEVVEANMTHAATTMAVMRAHVDNHVTRLEEIKEFVKDVNENVKTLDKKLTDVLFEMRKQ